MNYNCLTPCMNHWAKIGNIHKKFMHSNWITLSTMQVLNSRACFLNVWYNSFTSVHCNLEHGLVTLIESFSPLESELHNQPWWNPNEKCHNKPYYSLFVMCTSIQSEPVWTDHHQPKLGAFKFWDVELIYVHFYLSYQDILYIKMTDSMSRFQILPCHTIKHMHINNVWICVIVILQQNRAKKSEVRKSYHLS